MSQSPRSFEDTRYVGDVSMSERAGIVDSEWEYLLVPSSFVLGFANALTNDDTREGSLATVRADVNALDPEIGKFVIQIQ